MHGWYPPLLLLSLLLLHASLATAATASSSAPVPAAILLKAGATRATLSWMAPSTNVDGSPLEDLSAFNIYRGSSAGSLRKIRSQKGSVTKYTATGLSTGVYYFAIRSVNAAGKEGPQILIGPVIIPGNAKTVPQRNR